MRVTLNGDARELGDGITVEQLVRELGLGARRIAVEINLDVVPRTDYAARALRDGDVVEIVQFIGGG
jgi:sulfur carrier protein